VGGMTRGKPTDDSARRTILEAGRSHPGHCAQREASYSGGQIVISVWQNAAGKSYTEMTDSLTHQ